MHAYSITRDYLSIYPQSEHGVGTSFKRCRTSFAGWLLPEYPFAITSTEVVLFGYLYILVISRTIKFSRIKNCAVDYCLVRVRFSHNGIHLLMDNTWIDDTTCRYNKSIIYIDVIAICIYTTQRRIFLLFFSVFVELFINFSLKHINFVCVYQFKRWLMKRVNLRASERKYI